MSDQWQATAVDRDFWGVMWPDYEQPQRLASDTQESLLERAFEAAEGASENAPALFDVARQAREANLVSLAIRATTAIDDSNAYLFPVAVSEFLKDGLWWGALTDEVAEQWENRLIDLLDPTGYVEEDRATALGRMGIRAMAKGNTDRGLHLWRSARTGRYVDKVLAELALVTAQIEGDPDDDPWPGWALWLAGTLEDRAVKAQTLAHLAGYLV